MDLKNYLEQHEAIAEEISITKKLIAKSDLENNSAEIALHISTLAGKIKVHLVMEDKYLYPELQKRDEEKVKNLAEQFQKDMGDLAGKFVLFKDKYNTKQKIMMNQNTIKQDVTLIFDLIEKRVKKEERELYTYI